MSVAVLEAGGLTHQHDTISQSRASCTVRFSSILKTYTVVHAVRPAQFGREHGNPELVYGCVSPTVVLSVLCLLADYPKLLSIRYETVFQPNLGRPIGWPRYATILSPLIIN